ncbi:MAG: N-acetylornithine carbamoyltransferase [Ignavibacteria bacterium]|nr:N-acetylornithine carbamoyltransferase [Ignavibacteria bacterium]
MKNFLSVENVQSIRALVDKALDYKKNRLLDNHLGTGKTLGMLFFNPSLRTRVSTQVAARNLGMEVIVLNVEKEGWQLELDEGIVMDGSSTEHIKEAAAVLGQYFDILAVRTFPTLKDKTEDYSERIIGQFLKHAGVPVVSLESATLHPLQSLADLVTIKETFQEKRRPKVVMTWAPHVKPLPQSVPNSFAEWMNGWDEADFLITHPEGYELETKYTHNAKIEYNQDKALEGADYIYVKNWSSVTEYGKIINRDASWMITSRKIAMTNNSRVMHCLPVRRNVVIADEVLDGPNSIVIQQAGNRVWATQAVLAEILQNN